MKHYYVRGAHGYWTVVCAEHWTQEQQVFSDEAEARMWVLMHGIEVTYEEASTIWLSPR